MGNSIEYVAGKTKDSSLNVLHVPLMSISKEILYRRVKDPDLVGLLSGNSREEIVARDKAIKEFYSSWNAGHPDKKMWNEDLQDYIHIRFLSIEETSEKAARQYSSTMAVFRLSDLLTKAKKVSEADIKKGTKNQKPFVKMLIMQLDDIKMTVGVQKSGNKIQYCITSLRKGE